MTATSFSTEVPFGELHDDFVRLTTEIGWCGVATVDGKDRPRTRMLKVTWEIADGRPVGWVSTRRTPVKTAHLARVPYVSCGYWTAAQDAVFADCQAIWIEEAADKEHVWEIVAQEAQRQGFDPHAIWPAGAADPAFEVLRLDPWRVQVTLADLEHGQTIGSSRVWHATADRYPPDRYPPDRPLSRGRSAALSFALPAPWRPHRGARTLGGSYCLPVIPGLELPSDFAAARLSCHHFPCSLQ